MTTKVSLNQIGRQLRYLKARLTSAQLVSPSDPDNNIVCISSNALLDKHLADLNVEIIEIMTF